MCLGFLHFVRPLSIWTEEVVDLNRASRTQGFRSSAPESGLGATEHSQVCEAVLELADPSPAKKRRAHGSYTPAEHAQIGRYDLEHGNEKA